MSFAAHEPRTPVPKMGCGYAVSGILLLGGLGLLVAAQSQTKAGSDGLVLAVLGGTSCVVAIGLIAPMRRAVTRAKARRVREESRPSEPWTWDESWTEPAGIAQTDPRNSRGLTLIGVMAILFSSPAVIALPREIERGNFGILAALLFPIIGVALLGAAALRAWRRRKYGLARFVAAGIPVPFGGELAGMVLVDRPVFPAAAGRMVLECVRTSMTRQGGKRRERDETVAQTERVVSPSEVNTSAGETRLFVQLPIRGGEPTTMTPLTLASATFEWRLRVQIPTQGADFVADFVLPVFATEGVGSSAAEPAQPVDSQDRSEVFRAAGIHEEPEPLANRRVALQFPSRPGREFATAPLVLTIVFGATAAVLFFTAVPTLIAVFVAVFAVLPGLVLKALLSAGGERVWIEPGHIVVQRDGRDIRRLAVSDVEKFDSFRTVSVGAHLFYRIVARARTSAERQLPRGTTVVSMVRGTDAAAAVIAWLLENVARRE